MRRTLLVSAVLAVLAALAGPALATTAPPVPVGVWQRSDGSICFAYGNTMPVCTDPVSVILPATSLPVTLVNNDRVIGVAVTNSDGTPLAAAVIWKDGSNACAGFSYQAPICLS